MVGNFVVITVQHIMFALLVAVGLVYVAKESRKLAASGRRKPNLCLNCFPGRSNCSLIMYFSSLTLEQD